MTPARPSGFLDHDLSTHRAAIWCSWLSRLGSAGRRLGIILLLVVGAGTSLQAQDINPFTGDRSAIRVGNALFDAKCAACHGANAKGLGGVDAPDLTRLWSEGASDRSIFDAIEGGVEGSIMPAHPAPAEETWAIVSYLRTLNNDSADAFDAGNVPRGQVLFQQECADCHRVNGRGGRLGPDLTRIVSGRSREQLLQAVREPGAAIARRYETVRFVTFDGEAIEGTLKGQDAFSLQIMDRSERLRAFQRTQVRELSIGEGSLMPAFSQSQLGEQGVQDVYKFLAQEGAR